MGRAHRWLLAWALVGLMNLTTASAQVTTGSIIGTVTDNTGAVLPGVTISLSGAHLIGGTQTRGTAANGTYRFDQLPPGAYRLKFELSGFGSVERQDIVVNATFTATVNMQLSVGSLQETVTVTGESPTVDTTATLQQTVMSQDILEKVPTGRDVWSVAKIIPGVTVSTYDVGGTQGMQQSGMTVHGATDNSYLIDGLAVNWPGGGGSATMVYYDQGMFEEIDYKTSALPAEVPIGGVSINMVTKAGGNTWRGEARYYWANDTLQAENFADVSAQFKFPGGNPVTRQYDFNAQVAGPILKDRIWFFSSYRRWRVDKKLLSTFNPDGSNAIDDNRIWNASGKLTVSLHRDHKVGVVYNYNQKSRFHRRSATFEEDRATYIQDQPGYTGQVKYTGVLTPSTVFESTAGGVAGIFPLHYQKEVQATDVRRTDSTLQTATGAAPYSYENPNYRFQWDNVVTHTRIGWGGSHTFKAGVQFNRQYYKETFTANYDMALVYNNGRAQSVTAYNTPSISENFVRQIGFFAQDTWGIGRVTLNLGLRVDNAKGWMPEQSSPAGRWVGERHAPQQDVYSQTIGVWRLGLVYDLFGNGRTAVKGNYSRYGANVGIGLVTSVNPVIYSTATIPWSDRNGDNFPQPDELGAFQGFTGGATTRYATADGTSFPYSDELSVGVERELMRNVRAGVTYFHRTNRRQVGTSNVAVPPTAYTAASVTDPLTGAPLTFYNLNPVFVGAQQNIRNNFDALDTDYNGVEFTAAKRFSDRWQMLFGYTLGKNEGGLGGDFNDPNTLINQQGIIGNDATHQLRLSGTYLVPWVDVAVSGSFVRNTGYPRTITYQINRTIFPGLTRSSQNVRITAPGDLRLPSVTLLDLRFSRPIRFGSRTFEPQLDIFNVTNADTIVSMVNTVGARLGYPSEILAPRIVRLGFSVHF